MNLTTKYLEDAQGNKYAPVTVPSAVRWANGDDLDDKLAEKQAVIDSSNKLSASNVSGLANVATSGSYNDLSNTPTIPAAQVNSDWDAASGIAQILNKPSSLPANGGNAATVNNHTVLSDVPANAVFTDTTYSVMGASGSSHASGLVPDPGSTAGTTKFLREDGSWNVPNYPNVGLPVGSGTATSLANLPVTNRMIVATISANQASVSISNGVTALTAGCELHVVVKATAAATITLPTSSPYINMNSDNTLSLAANSYAEINFISDGTNIYVRAIA